MPVGRGQEGFLILSMFECKHSVAHRVKSNKERKEPRILRPPDESIRLRTEGATVQQCGDSNVAEKWIVG